MAPTPDKEDRCYLTENNVMADEISKDDLIAGGAGAAAGGGAGAIIGGLGGAGLAIGGTAVGIPAVAVVGIPAVAAGAVAFVGWKAFKALKNKKK